MTTVTAKPSRHDCGIKSDLEKFDLFDTGNPKSLNIIVLKSFLPKIGEMPDDLLGHISEKSRGGIQLDLDHLPALYVLSALKTGGLYSEIMNKVSKGQMTPNEALRLLLAGSRNG